MLSRRCAVRNLRGDCGFVALITNRLRHDDENVLGRYQRLELYQIDGWMMQNVESLETKKDAALRRGLRILQLVRNSLPRARRLRFTLHVSTATSFRLFFLLFSSLCSVFPLFCFSFLSLRQYTGSRSNCAARAGG